MKKFELKANGLVWTCELNEQENEWKIMFKAEQKDMKEGETVKKGNRGQMFLVDKTFEQVASFINNMCDVVS